MTGTRFNQASNLIIGDDANELLRLGSVGIVAGFGGNDTIESPINSTAPGSKLFGGIGDDFLASRGIDDEIFGGRGNDVLVNESGRATLRGQLGDDTIFGEEDRNTVYGGAGNDSIFVREDRNVVFGGDGNDTIRGGEGNDSFAGGAGNDVLIATRTSDDPSFLFGNAGDDILESSPNADSLYGGAGNDSITAESSANASNMFLSGDKGGDTIAYFGSGAGAILDGDRSASLTSAGTDAGADVFLVGASATELKVFGGADNDSLFGTGSAIGANAEVFMGRGNDYFAATSAGSSRFSGDLGDDFGSIVAGGNDTVLGDPALVGTDAIAGNDTLAVSVLGGQNVIYGDDTSSSSAGNDSIATFGAGSSSIVGGAGNDTINTSNSGAGDTLIGGAGNDIYTFGAGDVIPFDSLGDNTYIAIGATANDTITVTPNDGYTGNATFVVTGETELIKTITNGGIIAPESGDEPDLITITGTADALTSLADGDDTLQANNLAATGSVFGGAGNDVLIFSGTDFSGGSGPLVSGLAGVDLGVVDGGAGDDSIAFTGVAAAIASVTGGAGNDTIAAPIFVGSAFGGEGKDVFDVLAIGAGAFIDAGAGDERINIPFVVELADATLTSRSTVLGGAGDDTISIGRDAFATRNDLAIDGGEGNDYLFGKLFGGDSIIGGAGNDTISGNASRMNEPYGRTGTNPELLGGDTLTGGAGADVFVLATDDALHIGADLGAAGTQVALNNPYIVYDGTSPAAATTGIFSGIQQIDVITDFNPEEDVILFNSTTWNGVLTSLQPGTNADEIVGATNALRVGSLAYLADNQTAGGQYLGNNVAGGGTANSYGLTSYRTLGADDFGVGGFALNAGGSENGEFPVGQVFMYDTDAGGLYYNGFLVAIFSGSIPTTLNQTNLQALPTATTSGGIVLI
ncbi:MAG: beta strand repeat-containing protein [Geitlerinemataceae cyanobacterium]